MSKHEEVEAAKATLKKHGYQVDNLWTIDDVKGKFDVTDEEAYDIMYDALTNSATMEQVWLAIELIGEAKGFELKEEE